jgi:phage baseplate assembly protein W
MMDAGQTYGRGVKFPVKPTKNGRLEFSEGPDNVRESIRIILTTEPGERPALPAFGAGLSRFLGAPNTTATWRGIRDRIETALFDWEPRVTVEDVVVGQDGDDPSAAAVTLTYRLVATGGKERIGLTVPLGRD